KAGVEIPREVEDLRKKGYEIACYAKINEAKELILQGDPAAFASIATAEIYASKAGITVDTQSIKNEAYSVAINSKISDIEKATKEENYGDAISAFNGLLYFIEKSGIKPKVDVEELRKRVLALGIKAKLKDAEEAIKLKDYPSAIASISIAEGFAERIGFPKDEILNKKKEICIEAINAKPYEIRKFLDENNFEEALSALKTAEKWARISGVELPQSVKEISKEVYQKGILLSIKEAEEALAKNDFSAAYLSLDHAKEFASIINDTSKKAEIENLERRCFEIAVEEKIKSAEANVSNNNYEDAIADISAAKGYASKINKSIDIANLEKQAYHLGISAQITELKNAIQKNSYDDAMLAYYTIKVYSEKINEQIPAEVNDLMPEVYKIGYKAKVAEAKDHLKSKEFTEAVGCIKEAYYCVEKGNIEISQEVENLRRQIYVDGIVARIENSNKALANKEYLEVLGNLQVIKMYEKEGGVDAYEIGRNNGVDIENLRYMAYKVGIEKNFEEVKKYAAAGQKYEALSAASIVKGYANSINEEYPKELDDILKNIEKI
ncbi:MAG: hypothetical protein ACK4YO_03025, partial [Candidatus Altarchaeaceae archaeon]